MVKVDGKETDPLGTRVMWSIARGKVFYERGDSWLSKLRNIMSIVFYIVAGQAVLERYTPIRIDLMFFAVVLPIGYVIGNLVIGYLDFKYGIMKKEAVFGTREVNPFIEELDKKVTRIEKIVERLERK